MTDEGVGDEPGNGEEERKPMKILYIVGDGSLHANQELKWSLRSLEKNCLIVDGQIQDIEPVVIGSVPEWFTGESIPFPDTENRKEKNILAKICHAIDEKLVEGDFQISADDHFWLRPTKLRDLPRYFRRAIIPEYHGGNNYEKAMSGTRQVLMANGYPAIDFTVHCNQWVNSEDMAIVKDLVTAAKADDFAREYGMVNWATWTNVGVTCRRIPLSPKTDIKIGMTTEQEFKRVVSEEIIFSINDEAFSNPSFLAYMGRTFSSKCRWEA